MRPINMHQEVKMGTIQLTVSDVEQSIHFYRDLLELQVMARFGALVFFSPTGHRRVVLDTWKGDEARAPAGHHGFYHVSVLFPGRRSLARVIQKLIDFAIPIETAVDYGEYEAIYLHDPDGIPVELYREIPQSERRKDAKGKPDTLPRQLDLEGLLAELR